MGKFMKNIEKYAKSPKAKALEKKTDARPKTPRRRRRYPSASRSGKQSTNVSGVRGGSGNLGVTVRRFVTIVSWLPRY